MNKNAFSLILSRPRKNSIEPRELETDPEYGEPELSVAMMCLFHHVNTARSVRDSTPEEWKNCSDEDFNRWGRYPTDLEGMAVK